MGTQLALALFGGSQQADFIARRTIRRARRKAEPEDVDQLLLGFFSEDNLDSDDDINDVAVETFEWTDRDIFALHDGVLERSLHALLDGRASDVQKAEVWAWVHAPLVPKDHPMTPFSYQACCACTGVDPTELQESLAWLTRHEDFRANLIH